jgi:hypothetical protein
MTSLSGAAGKPVGDSLKVTAENLALTAISAEVASRMEVPFRALRLQVLLHLPRIADLNGQVPTDAARSETIRIAPLVPPNSEWASPNESSAGGWRVRAVDESEARPILEHFHYLRSFRENSRHFGLYGHDSSRPVALASTSVNDVKLLGRMALRNGVTVAQSRVVSRVFGFPAAPHNAISMLLGQVGRFERRNGIRMLLTYVNPNLGFDGGSYRASNWTLAGEEPGTAYDYVDGWYVTGRALSHRYGTTDPGSLSQILGSRYERSHMALLPLWVFAIELHLSGGVRQNVGPTGFSLIEALRWLLITKPEGKGAGRHIHHHG